MAAVVRIKRKVGEDPHVALIAAKRRRTEAGGCGGAAAAAGADSADTGTVLQFVGTMAAAETALPAAVLSSVQTARRSARAAGAQRGSAAAAAAGLLAAKVAGRRHAQTEQQKAMRYRVVSRRRDLSANIPGHVIDVERATDDDTVGPDVPAAAAAAATSELTCNGVPLERMSVDPAAAYVFDLYVASAPLDADELDMVACGDTSLWELRTRGGSDSDASADTEDEDSNAEDNWRHDYPEELADSDYERYLEPDGECQLDLVRRLGAQRIADDSDDEPLAYGLEEAPGGDATLDDDAYERYKKRVLRELNDEGSEDEGNYYGDDDCERDEYGDDDD